MVGNGSLQLPLNKRQYFVLTGGPSKRRPETFKFVKLAKELPLPCDVDIPTADFQTPDPKLLYKTLPTVVDLILAGEPVYVGCMGGIGRTGLLLALVVKAFGVKNPVKYVRKHYIPDAVETSEQQKFVKAFKVSPQIYMKIAKARAELYWTPRWTTVAIPKVWKSLFWATNRTRMPNPDVREEAGQKMLATAATLTPQAASNERGKRVPEPRI